MKVNVISPIKAGGKVIASGDVELDDDVAEELIAIGAVEASAKSSGKSKTGSKVAVDPKIKTEPEPKTEPEVQAED